jgi:hypothetical protein
LNVAIAEAEDDTASVAFYSCLGDHVDGDDRRTMC